jgi:hypothetical protein
MDHLSSVRGNCASVRQGWDAAKLEQAVVNMDQLQTEAATAFEGAHTVFCTLGTTRKARLVRQEPISRRIDVDAFKHSWPLSFGMMGTPQTSCSLHYVSYGHLRNTPNRSVCLSGCLSGWQNTPPKPPGFPDAACTTFRQAGMS